MLLLGIFFTINYNLVALRKCPYLWPIAASLSQKFLTSAYYPAALRPSPKPTPLVWSSFFKAKSSKHIKGINPIKVVSPWVAPSLDSISLPAKMKGLADVIQESCKKVEMNRNINSYYDALPLDWSNWKRFLHQLVKQLKYFPCNKYSA